MTFRRLLVPIIGIWLGGVLALLLLGFSSSSLSTRLIDRPHERAAKMIDRLGPRQAQQLLGWETEELNRQLAETWLRIEAGIAVLVFFVLLFATDAGGGLVILSAALMAISAVQMHWLQPHLNSLGRALDFGIRDAVTENHFVFVRTLSLVLDALKIVMGFVLALSLGGSRRRRKQFREEINPVYNADHGHINR